MCVCVCLQVFEEVYMRGWLDALTPAALKTDLVHVNRHLAITILGSTGGMGHRLVQELYT